MRQSELFSKTRKEAPKDEVSNNAKLLIKGGFIHKEMAGVYSFLPLGLRVLNKIISIIREEMNLLGGQEVFLSALQNKEVWESSGRWSSESVTNWFKTNLINGGETGLGFTHEEPITRLVRDHVRSFRDLPFYAYQFQVKFRNEERAKSGLMRTREFLMKDLYSFSRNQKEHDTFYDATKEAYKRIFERVGLGPFTHLTFASGGSFSKYSHEFQTVCVTGEDTIHICRECSCAVNAEIIAENSSCPVCGNKTLKEEKAVEVGNIFGLGTRFSEALGLSFVNERNESGPVVMGSYGIGPGRVMGVLAELFSDERSIIWPSSVSPFSAHVILLDTESPDVLLQAESVYGELSSKGFEVLFDDRANMRAGEKFADADLLGIPLRVVVSSRTSESGKVEVINRKSKATEHISLKSISEYFRNHV